MIFHFLCSPKENETKESRMLGTRGIFQQSWKPVLFC